MFLSERVDLTLHKSAIPAALCYETHNNCMINLPGLSSKHPRVLWHPHWETLMCNNPFLFTALTCVAINQAECVCVSRWSHFVGVF